MSAFYRIVLSKEDFAMLVQRKAILKDCSNDCPLGSVEIHLDIDFVTMLQEIGKAQDLGATQLAPC